MCRYTTATTTTTMTHDIQHSYVGIYTRCLCRALYWALPLSLYLSLSQRVHIVLLYSTAHNNNNNNNRTIRTSPCRYTQGTRQYTITNFRIYINVVVPMTRISSQHECGVYGDRFYNVEYNINIRTFTYNPIQYTLLAVVQFVHTHSVCIPIRSSQRLSQSASHPAIQPQPIKLYRIR